MQKWRKNGVEIIYGCVDKKGAHYKMNRIANESGCPREYPRHPLFMIDMLSSAGRKPERKKRVSMAVGTVRKPPAVFYGFHSRCEGEKGEVAFSLRRLAAALWLSLFSLLRQYE